MRRPCTAGQAVEQHHRPAPQQLGHADVAGEHAARRRSASTCRSRMSEISFSSTTGSPSVSPMNSRCPCATAAARLPWIARPAYGSDAMVSETRAIVLGHLRPQAAGHQVRPVVQLLGRPEHPLPGVLRDPHVQVSPGQDERGRGAGHAGPLRDLEQGRPLRRQCAQSCHVRGCASDRTRPAHDNWINCAPLLRDNERIVE